MARLVVARAVPIEVLLEHLADEWEERRDVVIVSTYMSGKMLHAAEKLRNGGHGVDWMPLGERAGDAA
jgi:hypothetical protein